MKHLLLVAFISLPAFAGTATQVSNSQAAYSNSVTSVNPMSFGGGDVLPSLSTVGYQSATCANNQLILDTVYTKADITGSNNGIGNKGNAIRATIIMPFGDDGSCTARQKAIKRDADLMARHNQAANTHSFCLDAGNRLKAEGFILDDEYYFSYPEMNKCKKLFEMKGISLIVYKD
tara:strand:+ start:11940 stop:12467 length:528 start_codon:yes stop_codon:yes gene_type:complete